jgi:hypothetical protein
MATATELIIDILAKNAQANSSLDATTAKIKAVGDAATKLGQDLTLKVTAPLVGIAGVAFKFASDSEETLSKFNAVFGASAEKMRTEFEALTSVIPVTKAEIQGMAAGMQDLLVPMGVAPDKASQMTVEIVKLAGDLASFNNIPVSVALDKIRAGLVGSYEPLLSFGVAINATSIKAKAFSMGIGDGKRELTAAEKAMVSFKAIVEGTTAAQGDAAKTADSSANSFKFLRQQAQEAATAFGKELLPIITPIIKELTSLLSQLNELDPSVKRVIITIGALAAAAGPLLLILGQLAKAFVAIRTVMALATTATTANTVALVANGEAALVAGSKLSNFVGMLKTPIARAGLFAVLAYELKELGTGVGELAGEIVSMFDKTEEAELNLQRIAEAKANAEKRIEIEQRKEVDQAYAAVQAQLKQLSQGQNVFSSSTGNGQIELLGASQGDSNLQNIIKNVTARQLAQTEETAQVIKSTGNEVANALQGVSLNQTNANRAILTQLQNLNIKYEQLASAVSNMR